MDIFKKNLMLEVIVSGLFAVTVCLFGPLEILLSQSIEFWFSVSDVLPLILVTTLFTFVITNFIFFLVSKINEVVLRIVISIVAALGFSAYIQGNWTFVNYGSMDGTPIDWSNYTTWAVINTLIWIILIITILWVINFKKKFELICKCLFMGVIGIQMITLGTLTISYVGTDTIVEFTLDGVEEFELSSNKENILVICADGFDGSDFLPVLEEEPDFRECFDGFTFYEDTCGTSLHSEESGITLLTGQQFEVGPSFAQNVKTAYENTDLYDILKENNYKTYIYCEEKMVSPDIADYIANYNAARSSIGSKQDAFKGIYKMVAFRYMPHLLKKDFWYSTMEFSSFKGGESRLYRNYGVYEYLEKHGVQASETKKNIYQFLWIQGPHDPVNTDRNCRELENVIRLGSDEYSRSQFEQTIGVVKLFTKIIDSLKEAGIYDNTTVIFTADHGWDVRMNPLLLVKPANSRGDLVISNAPVSVLEDYLPTLRYFITGQDTGNTIYSLEEGQERDRKIYVYDINSADRTYNSRTTEFYPQGIFITRTGFREYLPTDIRANAIKGFSFLEISPKSGLPHVWSDGHEVELAFRLKNESFHNIRCELNYGTFNGIQSVEMYANDSLIAWFIANGTEKRSVIIPGDLVTDGELILKFLLPNAIAPATVDSNRSDKRLLALDFGSIGIFDTNEEVPEEQLIKLDLDSEVNFASENNTASNYCVGGFSNPGELGTWTNLTEASMKIILNNYYNTDLAFSMSYRTFNGPHHVTIYANDTKIESYIADGEETKTIVIPADCIKDGVLNLRFELPDARSPKELGISEDSRTLALNFRSMKISEKK